MSTAVTPFIAIIDDDESICRALSRLLRVSGFQAITYSSSEEFLSDARHPKFDCLLLDIHFNGMSGLELSRRLAATGSQTPFIFISADDNPAVREQAMAAGCVAHFQKPAAAPAVLAAIRMAIA